MELRKKNKKHGFLKFVFASIFLGLVACGLFLGMTYLENGQPELSIDEDFQYLGKNTSFHITARDKKSGLKNISLSIVQQDKTHLLFERTFPRNNYIGMIGAPEIQETISFNLKKAKLKEGKATLVLQARDYSLRHGLSGNLTQLEKEFLIDTSPPKIHILHTERYIQPGGSGIVLYSVDAGSQKHGVKINGAFFRGYPVGADRENTYISYIALPYTAKSITESAIIALDAAGNKTVKPISPVLQRSIQKTDKIRVGDTFLQKKLPEFQKYLPDLEGSLLEQYLFINQKERKKNNDKIKEICSQSIPEQLWNGVFNRMPGANRAGFADHRTYYYKGKAIDKQVHLGIDIASTQHAPVKAANSGRVIFADFNGIYGNMIIIDHGQGVFSLYSHLSQINVNSDDQVDKSTIVGLTGISGMAGGDHLHFSMLVSGIFVTPKEWWDARWIETTIDGPLFESKF